MPDTIDSLVRGLSDEDRAGRKAAEDGLVMLGAEAVGPVLTYVGEGQPAGLGDAEPVLRRLGTEATRRLREIRRQGPGQLRGKALVALAALSGGEDLEEPDRSAVERLVRIKLLDEFPARLPSDAGRWLAFPADRLDDAVAALSLHDLRPATTVAGVAAATKATDSVEFPPAQDTTGQDTTGQDTTGQGSPAQGTQETAYRVFITAEFKSRRRTLPIRNWRLLWGNSFLDELSGFTLADTLSRHCGEAHFYSVDPYNEAENWYVSRDGHLVRSFSTYADPQFVGDPLPFEVKYRDESEDPREAAEFAEGCPYTSTAAGNLSLQPGYIPAARAQGHGWLATTHPDVPNSRFPGALPI
ncbi:hypothetical protein ACFQVC_31190 [Streptomyces monticola]|uniref:HEAT repeat domain-containing protein n=1 Tax=Streptomyces monticola TaxID=2666263 RepID=A0ABW2JSN2_9ACTN